MHYDHLHPVNISGYFCCIVAQLELAKHLVPKLEYIAN